jgi:H+/gluconate symporter-like permease
LVLTTHPTTNLDALISVLTGVGCMMIAVFCDKFYWAKGLYSGLSAKRMPTWAARLLLSVVGSVFIIFGLYHLFYFAR